LKRLLARDLNHLSFGNQFPAIPHNTKS
jgi:hypothetical protein